MAARRHQRNPLVARGAQDPPEVTTRNNSERLFGASREVELSIGTAASQLLTFSENRFIPPPASAASHL